MKALVSLLCSPTGLRYSPKRRIRPLEGYLSLGPLRHPATGRDTPTATLMSDTCVLAILYRAEVTQIGADGFFIEGTESHATVKGKRETRQVWWVRVAPESEAAE